MSKRFYSELIDIGGEMHLSLVMPETYRNFDLKLEYVPLTMEDHCARPTKMFKLIYTNQKRSFPVQLGGWVSASHYTRCAEECDQSFLEDNEEFNHYNGKFDDSTDEDEDTESKEHSETDTEFLENSLQKMLDNIKSENPAIEVSLNGNDGANCVVTNYACYGPPIVGRVREVTPIFSILPNKEPTAPKKTARMTTSRMSRKKLDFGSPIPECNE